jgi:hypothetical protein
MNERNDLRLMCLVIAKQFATDIEDLINKANLLYSFLIEKK